MPPTSLPPCLAGRYRPIRHLGSGGMGAVFLVEHVHTGERLALKLLRAQSRLDLATVERFRREARIAVRLKSEHVVHVVDADVAPELEGAPFLVMELLKGRDLGALAAAGPLPPGDVVEWLGQAARALDRAHALGVVHRDLKPENLFLTKRDDGSPLVKVLDFGLAKFLDHDETDRAPTASGVVFGTPIYMSPEQAMGLSSALGPPADLWSLAMVAYRLLSGRPYWDGGTPAHVLAQIVYERVAAPSTRGCDLGEAFDQWFLRSCRPDPASRWPSAGVQIGALAEALGQPAPRAALTSVLPDEPGEAGPSALAEPTLDPTLDGPSSLAPATNDPRKAEPPAKPAAPAAPAPDETPSPTLGSLAARTSTPSPRDAAPRRRITWPTLAFAALVLFSAALTFRWVDDSASASRTSSLRPPAPPAGTSSATSVEATPPPPPPASAPAPTPASASASAPDPPRASAPPGPEAAALASALKPPAPKPPPAPARPKPLASPSASAAPPPPKPAASLDPWDRD
ncbi:MAG TPA: serine/threonine-protein kinase [Polyangiaceae bacterium]|nr:serine/threonine-protein kinase [Polyangiaceae bacterium]